MEEGNDRLEQAAKIAMDREEISGPYSRDTGTLPSETVQMYICQVRKPGGLKSANLSPSELEIVKDEINQFFRGYWESMKKVIDGVLAVIFSSSLIFGSGYGLRAVHDFVRKDTLEQISQGLSSSEKLANSYGEKLDF